MGGAGSASIPAPLHPAAERRLNLRTAAAAVGQFFRQPVSAIWNGGPYDALIASFITRKPKPESMTQAREAAQNGDPSLWYSLATETLRDSHVRADVNKAAEMIASAEIIIQEPQAYRSWSGQRTAEAKRATEIRQYIESQLLSPHLNIREVLQQMGRALIIQSLGAVEVRVSNPPDTIGSDGKLVRGQERLESLRPIYSHLFGWDWTRRGGKMVLRPTIETPLDQAPTVEELGPSVVIAQFDADIADPTLRGNTWPLIALWILRISSLSWWARFAQKFAIPILWGTAEEAKDRGKLSDMLAKLGADGHGAFFKGTDLKAIESKASSGTGGSPGQVLFQACGRELSTLILGHELASGLGDKAGSENTATLAKALADAKAQSNMNVIASAICEQYICKAVERVFGPDDAEKYCPEIRLLIPQAKNLLLFAQAFDIFMKHKVTTLTVGWFHEMTGAPMPEGASPGDPLGEPCMEPDGVSLAPPSAGTGLPGVPAPVGAAAGQQQTEGGTIQ